MTAPENPPPTRWSRFRPRRRGAVVGAVVLALLVVAGVATALILPLGGPDRGGHGDDRGRAGIGLLGDERFGPGHRGRGGEEPLLRGDDAVLPGTVVSVGDGTLVLTPDGAPQRTLRTDDRTRVRGRDDAGLGDLRPGERVVVRVDGTGDAATAVAVLVPQARVAGTVTAITGDTATVVGIDGLTVTADVAGLAQRPAVGDVVVLTGTASGSTLTADGVRILPRG